MEYCKPILFVILLIRKNMYMHVSVFANHKCKLLHVLKLSYVNHFSIDFNNLKLLPGKVGLQ